MVGAGGQSLKPHTHRARSSGQPDGGEVPVLLPRLLPLTLALLQTFHGYCSELEDILSTLHLRGVGYPSGPVHCVCGVCWEGTARCFFNICVSFVRLTYLRVLFQGCPIVASIYNISWFFSGGCSFSFSFFFIITEGRRVHRNPFYKMFLLLSLQRPIHLSTGMANRYYPNPYDKLS